jgi:hypothetical protein
MIKPGDTVLWCWRCGMVPEGTPKAVDSHFEDERHQAGPEKAEGDCGAIIKHITIPEGLGTCTACGMDFCWLEGGETICRLCRVKARATGTPDEPVWAVITHYMMHEGGSTDFVGPFTDRRQAYKWFDSLHGTEHFPHKIRHDEFYGSNVWDGYGIVGVFSGDFNPSLQKPFECRESPWRVIERYLKDYFSGSWALDPISIRGIRKEVDDAWELAEDWLDWGVPYVG